MTARSTPSAATGAGLSTTAPAPGRPTNSRPKTDPTCAVPDTARHNSVRAAREGCTCSGALIAAERERDKGRAKNRAQRQRDAQRRVAERLANEAQQAAEAQETQRRKRKPRPNSARGVPSPPREPRVDTRLPIGMALRPATNLEKQLRARDDLACLGEDPELFFPVGAGSAARAQETAAKRVCGRCPALDLCGTVSLQVLPSAGVQGGFTPADRRNLRARGWAA